MNQTMTTNRKVRGALSIPVLTGIILTVLCAVNGKAMIANKTGFNFFVLYTAIVMLTTMVQDGLIFPWDQ